MRNFCIWWGALAVGFDCLVFGVFFTLRWGKVSSSKTFAILYGFTGFFSGWVSVTGVQLLHVVGGVGGWFLFFGARVFFHIVTFFSSFGCNLWYMRATAIKVG